MDAEYRAPQAQAIGRTVSEPGAPPPMIHVLRKLSHDMDLFVVFIVVWIIGLSTVGVIVGFIVTALSGDYTFHQYMNDLERQGNWIVAGAIVLAARVLRPLGADSQWRLVRTDDDPQPEPRGSSTSP
jgi:hypothetical protein